MKLLILLLLASHLLAVAVFEKSTRGTGRERIAYNLILNAIAFLALFSLCCSDGDTPGKLTHLFRMEGSYRDGTRLSLFLLLHVFVAWLLAILYRHLAEPGKKSPARVPVLLLVLTLVVSSLGFGMTFTGIKKLKITEIVAGKDGSVTVQNVGELSLDPEKITVCGIPVQGELLPGETCTVSVNVPKKGGVIALDHEKSNIETVSTPDMKNGDRYVYGNDVWTLIPSAFRPKAPAFSVSAGCYDEPFDLRLSADRGCRIYYTLDGSIPDMSKTEYSRPIGIHDRSDEIDLYLNYRDVTPDYLSKDFSRSISPKATVVRAVAVDEDDRVSETVTATYLVGIREKLPVISLVLDPEDLFGENGLYVTGPEYDEWYLSTYRREAAGSAPLPNFMKEGQEWTRPASFEIFENGKLSKAMDVSARIYGISSRRYERKEFGLTGPDGDYLLKYGKDTAIAQTLASGRAVTVPTFRRAVLYLNGEQWENVYLCRDLSSTNLGGITVNNGTADSPEVQEAYEQLFEQADSYDSFIEIADLQSYIDESCLRVYLADIDRKERWRSFVWKPDGGKWMWGLYDLNFGWDQLREGFSAAHAWEIDPFTMRGNYQDAPVSEWSIFRVLCSDDRFVTQYALTMMDLINTSFSHENTSKVLHDLGIYGQEYVDFFENRAPYAIRYTAQALGLSGETGMLEIHSGKGSGSVRLNSIEPEMKDGWFRGEYYIETPVELTAQGEDFRFWRVTQNGHIEEFPDRHIFIPVKDSVTVEAVFE